MDQFARTIRKYDLPAPPFSLPSSATARAARGKAGPALFSQASARPDPSIDDNDAALGKRFLPCTTWHRVL